MIHQVLIGQTSIPITAVSYNTATYNGGPQTASVASVTPTGASYSTPTPAQTNAGTWSTSITGNGAYRGTVSNNWKIDPLFVTFSYSNTSLTYNGGAQGPTPNPSHGGATFNNSGNTSEVNAGSYTIYSNAYGNYSGSGSSGWTINKANQSTVSISGPSTGYTGSSYNFTASGGNAGNYQFGSSGSGTSNPNNVYFGSAGSYSVTVYREATTNYYQSNTATAYITITDPITCNYYDIYAGWSGEADVPSYTTCAGTGSSYYYDFGDPGNYGQYATTLCARTGTVSTSGGTAANIGSSC